MMTPAAIPEIGYFDYNDLATQSTPLAFSAATFLFLTNDGLGPFTNKMAAPAGIADVWSAANGRFEWDKLSRHDQLMLRVDVAPTFASPNATFELVLDLAIGSGNEYSLTFTYRQFKASGAYPSQIIICPIYLGDLNTLNYPAKLKIRSDSAGTIKVNGWYVRVDRARRT